VNTKNPRIVEVLREIERVPDAGAKKGEADLDSPEAKAESIDLTANPISKKRRAAPFREQPFHCRTAVALDRFKRR
jgi:hypothetical protein